MPLGGRSRSTPETISSAFLSAESPVSSHSPSKKLDMSDPKTKARIAASSAKLSLFPIRLATRCSRKPLRLGPIPPQFLLVKDTGFLQHRIRCFIDVITGGPNESESGHPFPYRFQAEDPGVPAPVEGNRRIPSC